MYTFNDVLNRALRIAPASCAVVCGEDRRTYSELGARCRRLAGAMRALGLEPGDRIGVAGLNSDRYLELYLGLPAAGFVLVPVNSRLAAAEMAAILDDAGVGVVFADADYPGVAAVKRVLTMPGDYEDLIASADEIPLGEDVAESDLAALFYTSGTTGAAKGAMHTHRSLVSSGLHFMATWPFDDQTKWLVASPMFHTGGIIGTLATVWGGGTHVIMPRFDPGQALDLIEREAVTHTLLVPTMLAATARAQLDRPRDVSSLRYLSHGASPITADTLRRTRQAFPGAELLHVYGTTEATPITTLLPHEERILDTPRIHSCGQPAVGVDLRIVDSSLAEVPAGSVGEIMVSSSSVMTGYWQKPEATAEVMRGNWYLTGDLGYRDEESYLYLVDRSKDMIVSGGENIYSTEVEDALCAHPAVAEAAVFGVPDARWGESVYAVVVVRQDVEPDQLVTHCRSSIAGFKVPRTIELRTDPLPKSAAGKVLKRDLRDPHWAGHQTKVSGG
ncbi:MAG TPA: long-chain-fatty-acid--CoA ligase [Streptosporangiaceae bacterium]|nr:long-chain-fatty-acid--CoA ligase [Streptosporangiaceae bacterium]